MKVDRRLETLRVACFKYQYHTLVKTPHGLYGLALAYIAPDRLGAYKCPMRYDEGDEDSDASWTPHLTESPLSETESIISYFVIKIGTDQIREELRKAVESLDDEKERDAETDKCY